MAKPYSVDTLIDYAFRRLGEPVIDINVDRQQAEERVEDALDFFTERHFDGVQKTFHKHKVTGDDITNGYINTSGITLGAGMTGQPEGKDLLSVTKVLRFGGSQASMFSVRYQMSLNDYFGVNRHMGGSQAHGGLNDGNNILNQRNNLDLVKFKIDCMSIWIGLKIQMKMKPLF
mgnify:CR=1 FL=1